MKSTRSVSGGVIRLAILLLFAVGTLFPFYFLVITSVKSEAEFTSNYFLPPLLPDLTNLFDIGEMMWPFALNSVFVSLASTGVLLLVVVPAAYAFTWMRFPGSPTLYTIAISTLMVPAVLIFVPQFVLIRQLGLLNDHWGVILPFVATSIGVSIFLLRSFFGALPYELIEAARIDGAREPQILGRIVLPLMVPSVVTVAVVVIVTTWNAFLWPLVVITSDSKRLSAVAVTFLRGSNVNYDATQLMAGYLVASLPLILMLIVLLRYFIRGLTAGAVKG